MDPEKRFNFLRKAEKLLLEEMPIIPLFFLTYHYVEKPYVKGVYRSNRGFIDFKEAYIEP